jgi:tetratricopeptide (TPR) repeat protein
MTSKNLSLLLLPALFLAACSQPVRPTESEQEPVKAEAKLPDVNLTGDLLYDILLGEVAGRRGNFQVSVLALTRAAQKSRDPRLAERATKAAIYAKQYGLGLKAAKLWAEYSPDDNDALQSLAALYLYRDEPVQAQLYFEKVLKIAAAEKRLGHVYLEITGVMSRYKNRDTAMEVMQTLAALYPRIPEGQYALAHLGLRSGHTKESLAAINNALALRSRWDDAALLKSQILIATNAGPGVEKHYRSYLNSYPQATRVRLSFARYLVDLKRWEIARTEFAKVVESEPEDNETLYALALLSLQTGHLEDADKQFRRVVKLNPHHDQARLYLGQVAEKRKHYSEAISWYSGITTPPNRFEAQVRVGIVLGAQGKLDEARAHLANTQPKGEQQMVQRALAEEQILREARLYDEALQALTRILKKLPQNNDLLYARALVAERLDDLALHEHDLRKILKSDPKNAHALNALGYSLADRTPRHKEALALIQQAMDLRPNDAFILDSMGWVQYRMGNHAEAVRFLKQALSIRSDPEISAHLGEVLWVMGDRQAAEDVWQRALKTTPDSEPLLDIIKKFKP